MNDAVTGPVDIHSHLVPDVDDGARGLDGALEALERMMEVGFGRLITTPHLDGALQEEPAALTARIEEIRSGFDQLKGAAAERWPRLELELGFEVMLNLPGMDFTDERMRLGGTRFILVEWPRLQVPPGTERVIERMVEAGARPVIAHPERYGGIEGMGDLPWRWTELGGLLQVNWGSLVGRYGDAAQRMAFRILRAGNASYMASDFHGRDHIRLNFRGAKEALESMGGGETFRTLTETNPRRLWRDEEPIPVQVLPEATGFMAKLKRMIGGPS